MPIPGDRIERNARTSLSRRGFVRAGAGVLASAALLGVPAVLTGCGKKSGSDSLDVLTVARNEVVTLDAFKQIENPEGMYEVVELARYPKGTMLFSSDGVVAAALCLGETASPLSTIALVNLETGDLTYVLDRAVNHSQGFNIYAVRGSKDLIIWVESNYLTSDWMVYCATVSGANAIGQPIKVDEGNGEYDPPEIAVVGGAGYWVVQPAENGPRTKEDSYLKVASGGSHASNVLTSHGRFNAGLSTSGQILTAMPRADTSNGVYYQLTALSSASGSITASQVLPHSYRPSNAVYMGGAFAFTIPASYDYGAGISNVGTYYPISQSSWLRLAKQSLTPPGLCNGWMFAKSGSRTVFVNTKSEQYYVVPAPDACEDYGDYSVCTGEVAHVFNYATVGSRVVLRRITPTVA